MKTESEIINKALDMLQDPTKYPGMSYEEGIKDALYWILEIISDEDFIDGYKGECHE